jgi:hypothetical protein
LNCSECDYTCDACDKKGCISCSANRIINNTTHTCNCEEFGVSYQKTPYCSDCEVAILVVNFSDDLKGINVKFDFQIKI